MRRQIVAVAMAGTVAMLGLTATAQAQSASQQSTARATTSAAALRGSADPGRLLRARRVVRVQLAGGRPLDGAVPPASPDP